jgi:hypothetical protein
MSASLPLPGDEQGKMACVQHGHDAGEKHSQSWTPTFGRGDDYCVSACSSLRMRHRMAEGSIPKPSLTDMAAVAGEMSVGVLAAEAAGGGTTGSASAIEA